MSKTRAKHFEGESKKENLDVDRVINTLLRNVKDLVTIISGELKKIAGGFMEYLLLVHRLNKFQGILLTQQILRGYILVI